MGAARTDRLGERINTKKGSAIVAKYRGHDTVVLLYDSGEVETTTWDRIRRADRETCKKWSSDKDAYSVAVRTAKDKRAEYIKKELDNIKRDKYWVDNKDIGNTRWLGIEFRIDKHMCVVVKCHSVWNVDIMYSTGKLERNISIKEVMRRAKEEIERYGYAIDRCKKGIGRIGMIAKDKNGRERCIIDCENSEYKVQYKDGPIVNVKIK